MSKALLDLVLETARRRELKMLWMLRAALVSLRNSVLNVFVGLPIFFVMRNRLIFGGLDAIETTRNKCTTSSDPGGGKASGCKAE
ncbi:hypothetical protein CHELA40_10266 [Chelatococcus asaccharovorans]|nr:hypothetical protein CHELA40_10266 [Chelatococcus asaccharovorans]CAH1686912.1 hypothetical protein CHELA17_65344 [Chelatococcus asaccharovorans]